jgi:hypothetical protein
MKITPAIIEVMIHFYYYTNPTDWPQAYAATMAALEKADMLERVPLTPKYRITEKGRAWIAALCRVPLPVAEIRWAVTYPQNEAQQ